MTQLNIALAIMGGVAVCIALLSALIKRSPVSEPALAVLVGAAVGPYGLSWLDLARWGDTFSILEQAARLTLAIGLMGVALRLQPAALKAMRKPIMLLLTFVMLGMWLVSSLLAGWLLGLSLWAALLLGAVITPTDPVVASSIVTGEFAKKHLPLRLRDTLSAESGANDGLAYAFVMLPILMLSHTSDQAWSRWLLESVLIGIGGAALVGAVVGFAAAKLLAFAEHKKLVANSSLLGYTVAFSLLTLGLAKLLQMDGVLAVFAGGLAFNLFSEKHEKQEEENIQEAVAKLFTLPMFVIFGIALPLHEWAALGWPLLAFALLVLLLRRPPAVMSLSATWRNALNLRDSLYLGWFGPLGIAAIYYAALAHSHLHDPLYWHAASALIFASIMIHGVSAAPLSRLYSSHHGATPRGSAHLDE
ncbi:cation:proton antiporter domain-containing protein [Stutzerimonas xanthomarina]|uniref:Sodium/proton antiporter, CPA1 family n=2 Tax=Stutzerimonas xanthomarina TaxID=271420 RepID=A0A1M5MA28_9GAMM|nr:cation:proton antiporter [Stutzerimonas xanthomarina]MCP9338899.1 cation:proton antiporter [Stutzerimonas xanthomarina]SEH91267.1 NhaP-type Na+/H+ or K+/H+ antiporter [Stutzerimonas xanthomarina]SHG74204.1 sodium/proton antiporter, CPA1 family [Stutzerimonas xanthomarina DSM 18231]